jgi:SAM-dependent methyltransferase
MMTSAAEIQAEYERFHQASVPLQPPALFLDFNKYFAERQGWKDYARLLDLVPAGLVGGTVVDVGCKYGHVAPLFLARGARETIGIDVIEDYLATARRIVGTIYPGTRFMRSEQGYLPVPSDTVDLVFVNEVISHVNPMYLPNLYSEIGRILRPGGYVLISDGNNIANADCRLDLVNVYDARENGPAGRKTGRDIVDEPFIDIRRRIIRERLPSLPAEKVDYLARNTSGLFGDHLLKIIDRYAAGGDFTERPYRRGVCPTNPLDGGTVMEFGFHPRQVELELDAFGIEARQILPPLPGLDLRSAKLALGTAIHAARSRLRRKFWPDADRGLNGGFQILGMKKC